MGFKRPLTSRAAPTTTAVAGPPQAPRLDASAANNRLFGYSFVRAPVHTVVSLATGAAFLKFGVSTLVRASLHLPATLGAGRRLACRIFHVFQDVLPDVINHTFLSLLCSPRLPLVRAHLRHHPSHFHRSMQLKHVVPHILGVRRTGAPHVLGHR